MAALKKYKHGLLILPYLLCIFWYFLIQRFDLTIHLVHIPLDDLIPFNEWFVLPYIFWFVFFSGIPIFLIFRSRNDFIRIMIYLYTGVVICLISHTVYATGIDFRPVSFDRDNLLIRLVQFLYSTDRPVNAFPSLHCYNAIVAAVGLCRAGESRIPLFWKISSLCTAVLICLSTVFIKQHSALDIIGAVALAVLTYPVAYKIKWKFLRNNRNALLWL